MSARALALPAFAALALIAPSALARPAASVPTHAPRAAGEAREGRAQEDGGLAPDGKRGFGSGLTDRELAALLRSESPADREFLDGLTQLALETRLLLADVRAHYAARGYFALIPASTGDDVGALHTAYATLAKHPAEPLAAGDERAVAFARMLVDTRFNVRREFVARALDAVEDLERSRALLGATQSGYVMLAPKELEHVLARADFAAAELRTVRSDLTALAPRPVERPLEADELASAEALLATARGAREPARTEQVAALLESRRELEPRMKKLLFSSDAEPRLAELRAWRARSLAAAAELRARTLEMLPDTLEGERAPPDVARLRKSDRMSRALPLALEGMARDPLDAELAWAAGHARHFSFPGLESVTWFDRFLALSGVRTSDPRPANGRQLTPREQEAFSAVAGYRR